jgi:glucose/arabinose dehydrogenase
VTPVRWNPLGRLRSVRRLISVVLLGAVVVAASTADAVGGTPDPSVKLSRVVEVDRPTAMAVRSGDPTLYVADQQGRVIAVRDGTIRGAALDLRRRVTSEGEQGLLGLAFSPDGGRLYVDFTNRRGDTRIEEYAFVPTDDGGGHAEPTSRRVVLRVRQPQVNHNGGQLAFGPDGMLYIGLGDGGNADDEGPGHAPGGNGQSLSTLLGKILRIDPTPSAGKPYTIPPDNPFADGGGRPEIWSYGLRNPWRFSFDRATGDLWVADVGQNEWEEIDVVPAADGAGRGVNFGWNVFEGSHHFRAGRIPKGSWPPLLELSHDDGNCSVTGGYVYRGTSIPALVGAYVYADYCNGKLRWVRQEDNRVLAKGSLGVSADSIASFGEDTDGELYVLSQSGGLLRIEPR